MNMLSAVGSQRSASFRKWNEVSQCRSAVYLQQFRRATSSSAATPTEKVLATVSDIANAAAKPPSAVLDPPEIYSAAVAAGTKKASLPAAKILFMGIMAGMYISFGGAFAMAVGGSSPALAASNPGLQKFLLGFIGLPAGLLMVLVCGAELFTGNTALVAAALYEKKVGFGQLLKSWVASWTGNFIGSLIMVSLFCATGTLAGHSGLIKMTAAKTSMPFMTAFVKGILANWMVCIGIWLSLSAKDLGSKFLGAALPVALFVCLGLEHSIANMFFCSMGIALGAKVTTAKLLVAQLLPVTLGNIVGGAVCVAGAYHVVYGSFGQAG